MILEPPMISIAVLALTLCHPGVCFQGSWSSAKSAYRDRGETLLSEDFDDAGTMRGTMSSQDGAFRMKTLSKIV
jgi:hypothetical protein